jgi:signal transduction histidine kinase
VTARLRLTLFYTCLFVLSGIGFAALVITITLAPTQVTPVVKPSLPAKAVPYESLSPAKRAETDAILAAKAQARREFRDRLVYGAAVGVGVMALLSGWLGWLMAGRVLRPVHAMAATARRLSQRNLRQRLPENGARDEFRELAGTLNGMLDRLEQAFEAQRRFVGNASHELRAPLTTVRALVEVAAAAPDAPEEVRELTGQVRAQLVRQQRLIDGLLALASSEHGPVEATAVRLDCLVREALRELAVDGLAVSVDLDESSVDGDPVLLRLLVENLLRNAVRHNVSGGWVRVTVAAGTLEVVNSGEPVSAQRLSELTEPFRRGTRDRVGTGVDAGVGLGLAIVEAVARSHALTLELAPLPGGGVRALVEGG